jgi:hypothetical protein
VKQLPFQIFPGIFSSIDSYTKNIVAESLRRESLPSWLQELDVVNYIEPPHYSKFSFTIPDPDINFILRGTPDAIFQRKDGSFLIADYKTARWTDTQDELYPLYEVQLNVYAYIAQKLGLFQPLSGLSLIYMEPLTGAEDVSDRRNFRDDGFSMGFRAKIKEVPLYRTDNNIKELLRKTKEILDKEAPPPGRNGCKECDNVKGLVQLFSRG